MAAFVDTNILIYAFVTEADDANEKVAVARALLSRLRKEFALVLSAQVPGEFATNAVRKGNPPLTLEQTAKDCRRVGRKRGCASIDAFWYKQPLNVSGRAGSAIGTR